jgi:hypothetical protein
MRKENPKSLTDLAMSLYPTRKKSTLASIANNLTDRLDKLPSSVKRYFYVLAWGTLSAATIFAGYVAYKTITTPINLTDHNSKGHYQTNSFIQKLER